MNSIYALTPEEFTQLQQSGMLYKLYPELVGKLVNVQQFKKQQEEFYLQEWAYIIVDEFCQRVGCDPVDVVDVLRKHKETLFAVLKGDESIDWEEVIEAIRESEE